MEKNYKIILGRKRIIVRKEMVKKKNPLELINVRHKCGRVWKVTRSSLKILWCLHCKSSEDFKEIK